MKEALTTTLNQQQLQTLTPMQLQFVHVLEMTGPELEEEVRRVLDENPALEVAEGDESVPIQDTEFNETPDQLQLADYSDEDEIPHYRLEMRNYSPDSPITNRWPWRGTPLLTVFRGSSPNTTLTTATAWWPTI